MEEQDQAFDYRRLLAIAISRWPFILISLFLAIIIAYLVNRYTTRIYPVSMTILIKDEEEKESTAAEFLYRGSGFDFGKNYYNEELLLRSFPLVYESLKGLNFEISFFKQGDVKTTEIYPPPPIFIEFDSLHSMPYGVPYQLDLLSAKTYSLFPMDSEEEPEVYEFGQTNDLGVSVRHKLSKEAFPVSYAVVFNSLNTLANSYRSRLTVNWIKQGSSLISLSINGSTPQKEMHFLEALAKTYQRRDIEDKNISALRTIKFIDQQLKDISDSLQNLELQIELFKVNNLGTTTSEQSSRYLGQYDELVGEISLNYLRQQYLDFLVRQIESGLSNDQLTVPVSVGIENEILNKLVLDYIELQKQRSEMVESPGVENPILEQIDEKTIQLAQSIKRTALNLKEAVDITINEQKAQLNTAQSELLALPQKERQFINLNRLYKLSEELYLILLQKKTEASITMASNVSDVEIVNPPVAGGPIQPKTRNNYLIAVAAGMGVPLLILFLLEILYNRVRFKEDIERYTNTPFLGVIGHSVSSDKRIIKISSKSAVAESFRTIRSNLNFFLKHTGQGSNAILVTSSVSGEGKTFFSDNLSLLYAYSGKRTVLVAGDMRRPNIFQDFNVTNTRGLSNHLTGEFSVDEVTQPTDYDNLFIINSGPIPPNPSELLMRDQMKKLMDNLRDNYEIVVLDSPPISLVSDALILTEHVDHTIFIVRQNYTRSASLRVLQEIRSSNKIGDVSIVFNDVKFNRYSYGGYYNYGYYYGNGYNTYYGSTRPKWNPFRPFRR